MGEIRLLAPVVQLHQWRSLPVQDVGPGRIRCLRHGVHDPSRPRGSSRGRAAQDVGRGLARALRHSTQCRMEPRRREHQIRRRLAPVIRPQRCHEDASKLRNVRGDSAQWDAEDSVHIRRHDTAGSRGYCPLAPDKAAPDGPQPVRDDVVQGSERHGRECGALGEEGGRRLDHRRRRFHRTGRRLERASVDHGRRHHQRRRQGASRHDGTAA